MELFWNGTSARVFPHRAKRSLTLCHSSDSSIAQLVERENDKAAGRIIIFRIDERRFFIDSGYEIRLRKELDEIMQQNAFSAMEERGDEDIAKGK